MKLQNLYLAITLIIFMFYQLLTIEPVFLKSKQDFVQQTLAAMTLRQKIGQLFIVAALSNAHQPSPTQAQLPYKMDQDYIETLITDYHIGGIIFLGNSTPSEQLDVTQQLQHKAKIPLLIAQDCEWGLSMRLHNNPAAVVCYPHNLTLGAIQDPILIYQLGYEIGKQCAAIGVHMNLAPVVDVNNNPANTVIHDRSFGDNPERVALVASLMTRGMHDAGILTCAKHFPGHGDTAVDSHVDLPTITHSIERLHAIELYPFKTLIAQGISGIMNAHLSIPAFEQPDHKPSSLSYTIVTQLLKEQLGFNGLAITDGLGMQAVTKYYKPGELELQAFLAGNDLLLCPMDVPQAVQLIEDAITSGLVSQQDLNQRVLKILQAKAWVNAQHINTRNDAYITRPEAYALQKQLYRCAMTVAKNNLAFPLHTYLNNAAMIQCGDLPEKTFITICKPYISTILHKPTLSAIALQPWPEAIQNSSTIIISIGNINKRADQQFGIEQGTIELITTLKQCAKNVIVVLFGTPYAIQYVSNADAIIVAYEDVVPAQQAAADLLLGKFQATGKLPIAIDI